MFITPKYPPRKSCGIKPGTHIKIGQAFDSLDETFVAGEELIFLREMFDRDMGCDVWVFGTEESKRIEESLPEEGIINGRYLWQELVRHKSICGIHGLENPESWLPNCDIVS